MVTKQKTHHALGKTGKSGYQLFIWWKYKPKNKKKKTQNWTASLKCSKNKTVNLEFYIQQNNLKNEVRRIRWWRSRWTWSTSLSMDTSGIHLQTQKCMQNTSWEQTGGPDQQKRIYRPTQNSVGRRKWGKNWTCLRWVGERNIGAIVWVRGEPFKAESETADLWQPKWSENQTVLAAAIHTQDRDAGPLEGAAAWSWSLGIVEQSQSEGCCWLRRDRSRGCEGGDWCEMPVEESRAAMEARRYCWVVRRGRSHHHRLSLPTCQHWYLNTREAGPSNTWCTELQSRTPSSACGTALIYTVWPQPGKPLCAWHMEQQRRTPGKGLL